MPGAVVSRCEVCGSTRSARVPNACRTQGPGKFSICPGSMTAPWLLPLTFTLGFAAHGANRRPTMNRIKQAYPNLAGTLPTRRATEVPSRADDATTIRQPSIALTRSAEVQHVFQRIDMLAGQRARQLISIELLYYPFQRICRCDEVFNHGRAVGVIRIWK